LGKCLEFRIHLYLKIFPVSDNRDVSWDPEFRIRKLRKKDYIFSQYCGFLKESSKVLENYD